MTTKPCNAANSDLNFSNQRNTSQIIIFTPTHCPEICFCCDSLENKGQDKTESELIVYISYTQVGHHQLQLLNEINTSGIFREEANCKAKHDPTTIGDLIFGGPAKDPAANAHLRCETASLHVSAHEQRHVGTLPIQMQRQARAWAGSFEQNASLISGHKWITGHE